MKLMLLFLLIVNGLLMYVNYGRFSNVDSQPLLPVTDTGVPSLVLLSELEPNSDTTMSHDDRLVLDGGQGDDLACFTLGPIPSQSDWRRVVAVLRPHVADLRERQTTETKNMGYWVYLPELNDREKALDIARNLSQQGVRDYYVVTAGDRENTISLGLFSEYNNALRRQSALQSLGFMAEVTMRQDHIPVYWIDYQQLHDVEVPFSDVLPMVDGMRNQRIACP